MKLSLSMIHFLFLVRLIVLCFLVQFNCPPPRQPISQYIYEPPPSLLWIFLNKLFPFSEYLWTPSSFQWIFMNKLFPFSEYLWTPSSFQWIFMNKHFPFSKYLWTPSSFQWIFMNTPPPFSEIYEQTFPLF